VNDAILKQAVDGVVMVLTTLADDERAEELARMLVNERLAACVHVQAAGVSFYRWKGSVERDVERQLIIKTTRQKVAPLRERLATLHPYELPEFIVVSVAEASAEYLGWVREQTS
jgi:periplasmic divalent cation tolerance protein